MDPLTREQRRQNMQAIKSRDTKVEVLLRKTLWAKGHRYFKNFSALPGKPDIVFSKSKVAVFCDGEFWHGKDWHLKKSKISVNKTYWIQKIERNIERDQSVNRLLRDQGWTVIRFWEKEIHKEFNRCISIIEAAIFTNRQ